MKKIRSVASIAATAAALAIAAPVRTPGQGPGVGNYQLVSDVRVTRTVNELTYRAVLTNGAEDLAGATAIVTSVAPATTIVDDTLTFGPVGPGGTVVSTDTFSFRHDRLVPFAWSNLQWTITTRLANRAPTADAGNDLTGNIGEDLSLAGTLSADPDGDSLTYLWSIQSGPGGGAALTNPTAPTATFRASAAGTYVVALSVRDPLGGTAEDTATIIIREVTPPPPALPEISVDDVSVSEDDAGSTSLVFTITQSAPSTLTTRVNFTTLDGTATSPADYTSVSGTAEIAPGTTNTDISVPIRGDAFAEPDKTLLLRLSNPVNATIADGEGVGEIVDDDPGPPTTFELIDAALEDGLIDAETALVYRVFAEFQDARLPAQYLGRGVPVVEGIAITEAARRFDTLTPATQAILAPFLEFPDLFALPLGIPQAAAAEQPSDQEQRGPNDLQANASWAVIELVPGTIRMGWNVNSPQAFELEQAAVALEAEFNARIWPKLRTFLGAPVAGNKILIGLFDTSDPSYEVATNGCSIAKIYLNKLDPIVLTHELTHALLDLNFAISACNQAEKLWMHEATATWAQHYVYPPANSGREQSDAWDFLRQPERSLSAFDSARRGQRVRGHQYGAYLWFLRLAGQGNNPGIVRAMWEAAAGVTSLEGIEKTLRDSGLGGFEDQWPKFALDNWNRERPYRKYYEWDKLGYKASQHEFRANLGGAGWQTVQLGYDLPILSADYQRWDFTGDQNIRGILFQNTDAGKTATASIKMIVKIKGQEWRAAEAEDLARTEEKFFCRDKAEEDVEEVILVITNRGFLSSDPQIQDQGKFNLFYSALPCSDWTGSTTYRKEFRPFPGAVTVTTATAGALRFRLDLAQTQNIWKAVEGTITVGYNATEPFEDGTCTYRGSRQFDAKDRAQFELVTGGPNDPSLRFSGRGLVTSTTIAVTVSCSSSSGSATFQLDLPFFSGVSWFSTGPNGWPFDGAQTTIQGTYPAEIIEATERWTWNLAKAQ